LKAIGRFDWLIALDFADFRNWCKICHFNRKFFEKLRIEVTYSTAYIYESINTIVCVKLNNIRDPIVIQILFYSLALSQECSNHLGEHEAAVTHNEINESIAQQSEKRACLFHWI